MSTSPMGNRAPAHLTPAQLTCRCEEGDITRAAADAAPPTLPGQERGMEAVRFGLKLKKRYFNITVSGPSRSGKTTMVEQLAHQQAAQEPVGLDVCISPNFEDPSRPGVLYLSPGSGLLLNRLIEDLLNTLDEQLPKLVEQPAVKAYLHELNESHNSRTQALTREVEEMGEQRGMFLQSTPQGMALIPLLGGKPMSDEEFIALPPEERERINGVRREIMARMGEISPKVMEVEKERREATETFLESSVRQLVQTYITGLRERVAPHPGLMQFLDALQEELVEKRFLFLAGSSGTQPFGGAQLQVLREQFVHNCKLNVLVNRGGADGAPVIVENNPSYNNLMGGVDFVEERGVLKTDFRQIRAGSLVQASGGYLVVQAQDLLQHPAAYAALKRALRSGQTTLRDQFTEMGLRSGVHLEPAPVEVTAKVIVVGDDHLIQMLLSMDDEFAGLFKIHADFLQTLVRTAESLEQLVSYLEYHARLQDLLPLTEGAIARVVEEASRRVSHQQRLSAQVNELVDVLIEADVLARGQGGANLTRGVVHEALAAKHRRHDKIEEIVRREISEGTILLDCEGSKVGQVNALAVYQVGRVAFGIPTRITAQAYAGRLGIINVEREADLSGRLHTKGVLILNGYLGSLFARKDALALSVSITFEQSYGAIDGDSATCAEFLAVVSAISGVPLRQAIAVTGSMSQHGEVQPIGGVNEKVSGFYQFAKEHGFPDGCGVIIPAVNQVNLLLDEEVIQAVELGRFRIYPVRRIEEAVQVMTGVPAGEPPEHEGTPTDSVYPADSVYGKAVAMLKSFQPAQHARPTAPDSPDSIDPAPDSARERP